MIATLVGLAILALIAAGLVIGVVRRRRAAAVTAATELAELLIRTGGLTAPEDLPRAPAIAKSTRRRHTRRTAPQARKRRSGRWG